MIDTGKEFDGRCRHCWSLLECNVERVTELCVIGRDYTYFRGLFEIGFLRGGSFVCNRQGVKKGSLSQVIRSNGIKGDTAFAGDDMREVR